MNLAEQFVVSSDSATDTPLFFNFLVIIGVNAAAIQEIVIKEIISSIKEKAITFFKTKLLVNRKFLNIL